jgi:tetratricopeptide (TPR) repeat protein
MRIMKLALVFLFFTTVFGCTSKKIDVVRPSYLESGKVFLKERQLDLAEQEFEKSIQFAPEMTEAYLYLASIHVARAGISFRNFDPLIQMFHHLEEDQPEFGEELAVFGIDQAGLNQVYSVLKSYTLFKKVLEVYPKVLPGDEFHLRNARMALDRNPEYVKSQRLYRLLINGILLNSRFSNLESVCLIDFISSEEWQGDLLEFVADYSGVFPDDVGALKMKEDLVALQTDEDKRQGVKELLVWWDSIQEEAQCVE